MKPVRVMPTRIMIVDDHEVVRMGLKAALEPESDLEVVAEAGSAEAALRQAQASRPQVVLMDVRMPGADGIQACRTIREALPETRVIMLTSFSEEEAVFSAIMAGASGYLLKNVGRAELLRGIRTVASGGSLLDPSVTSAVLARLKNLASREDPQLATLSEREREVLALVAEGRTNREIADKLVISENTARNHVSRILEKLDMTRRSEAAAFAAQHGLLKQERPRDK